MSDYKTKIPRARVNITLDVETNGALKKKELPLKLLVLGNFSDGGAVNNIAERKSIAVNKYNLNQVMTDLGPQLHFKVVNKIKNNAAEDEKFKVKLNINSMQQFHPEEIIKQVPQLKKLVAMRNLLKEFRANLLDNNKLRCELEKIVVDKAATKKLQHELYASVGLGANE